MHFRRYYRGRGVGTHATRVGAGIGITNTFVVLAGGHGQGMRAINHNNKAGLFAFEELLHDHA